MLAENSKAEQEQPVERDDNDEEDYYYESEDYDEDYDEGEDEDEDYDESDDYDYSENEDDYDYLSNDTYDYDYDYDEDEPGDDTETGNSGDPEKSTKGCEGDFKAIGSISPKKCFWMTGEKKEHFFEAKQLCYDKNENSFPIQPKTYKELVKIKKEFKSAEDKIHFDFVWTNFERTNKTQTVWKNIEKTIVQGVEKLEEVVDGSVRRRNEKESGKEKNLKKMFR
ncbi:uncharacterized protein LOC142358285 [Convolutriloba macropyga]|uniref:uncharacterized protein LOC142358285 n=1 Tax=Convolutriloba macropyga TaxID=536237 RepID=UPI003F51B6ED